jgi:hypothetical protein
MYDFPLLSKQTSTLILDQKGNKIIVVFGFVKVIVLRFVINPVFLIKFSIKDRATP